MPVACLSGRGAARTRSGTHADEPRRLRKRILTFLRPSTWLHFGCLARDQGRRRVDARFLGLTLGPLAKLAEYHRRPPSARRGLRAYGQGVGILSIWQAKRRRKSLRILEVDTRPRTCWEDLEADAMRCLIPNLGGSRPEPFVKEAWHEGLRSVSRGTRLRAPDGWLARARQHPGLHRQSDGVTGGLRQ